MPEKIFFIKRPVPVLKLWSKPNLKNVISKDVFCEEMVELL